jgi:hypothetical protein
VKNNLLCDIVQRIWFMSASEAGSVHDKKLADEYPLLLPAGSVLRQDTGFLGHYPAGVLVEQPYKTPRGGELSFSQRLYNRMLSGERVVIEHANSGVKRLRMLKDTVRLHGRSVRDSLLEIGCGLHNLRVMSPHRSYLAQAYVSKPNQSQ